MFLVTEYNRSVLLGAAILLICQLTAETVRERYNVLFLIIDDASPVHHSVFQESPVLTPNLQRLADSSVWFSRAYTHPACNVSRMSFLSGLRPSTTGVYYNGQSMRSDERYGGVETIPERFKAEGYLTAGYGKVFHNGYHDLEVGSFSEGYFVPYSSESEKQLVRQYPIEDSVIAIPGGPGNYTFGVLSDDWDRDDPEKMQQDTVNANLAIEFLESEHDQPFFLAYGSWRPHVHWTVAQRYFDRYPLEDIKIPEGFKGDDLEDLPKPGRWIANQRGTHNRVVRNGLWKRMLQGLYAATTYADEQIGRVLTALDNSPYKDNTIVVFLADNGWHTGQKYHWSKYTLWDQATRVPMAIRVPHMEPQVVNSAVSSLDIYPTLMELTGMDGPKGHELEGTDLTPILKGEISDRGRPVVITYGWQNHAVINDRFRYIRYQDGNEELYDHWNDPHEWHNLATNESYRLVMDNMMNALPTINREGIPFTGRIVNTFLPEAFE